MATRVRAISCTAFVIALGVSRSATADSTCLDASEAARASLSARKLIAARAALRDCARDGCDETVRLACDTLLGDVVARLPSFVFDVKDADGRDVVPAIALDGIPLSEAAGTELVVDPGPHAFTFEVKDIGSDTRTFVALERQKGRRETVVLGARPTSRPPVPAMRTSEARDYRFAGWLGIGAGAVGLGIGTAFGIDAIVKNGNAGCDDANVCDDPRARSDARSAATVSTAAFIAGSALVLAGAAILFFARPRTTASVPSSFRVTW